MKLNPTIVNHYKSFLMDHGGFSPEQVDLIVRAKAGSAAEPQIRMEASDGEAELYLYDSIGFGLFGGITAQDFVQQVKELGTPKAISLRINSPGGDVFDAVAMMNFLKSRQSTINVTIDGLSASAATIVQMAGDTIQAVKGSMLMIHRAWGVAIGNTADMLDMGALLEKIDGNIAAIYAKRGGRRKESYMKLMDAESWFTAEQALEQKLIDKVIDGDAAINEADLAMFGNVPADLRATPPAEVEPELVAVSQQTIAARLRELQMDDHQYGK